ncbi:MAG: glycoside hydrolase family 38 C-terminal domain-containing protein [Tessaracoccus sp.]
MVPHTHWDREWYEPHDVFRARLVAMMDRLLDILEREPVYAFTLDGQSAAIEDYLEIRPERRERVAAAVARGQLALGPFQILLDEFTCDGETTIRNLEHGIASARRLGQEMRVGYLPDMFGHVAQMPQILRGFGLTDAALWRGVPASVDRHAFVWEALDGSVVRVEYLWDGYGSALKLFEPVEKASELIEDYLRDHSSWFGGEDAIGMFGADHTSPRCDFVDIVRGLRLAGGEVQVKVATLGQVIASRDHSCEALAALPRVRGELRSHARGNLLPGVLSIRPLLKAAMARAERDLTAGERLDAVVGGDCRVQFFRRGWALVIESSAHDSVNGCGIDSTADQVENRLRIASHTARGAIDIALPLLGAGVPVGEVAAFNPSGWARDVQVELMVERDELPEGVQVLEELPRIIGDEQIASRDLDKIIRRIHGQELFGKNIRSWRWSDDELHFMVAEHTAGDFELAPFVATLRSKQAQTEPGHLWRVITEIPRTSRVLLAGHAEGMGVAALGVDTPAPEREPATASERGIGNGRISAEIDVSGEVCIIDHATGVVVAKALRLVDEGDRGDTYNYGALDGGAVTAPVEVEVEVLEQGPLRARLLLRRSYDLPIALSGDDRSVRSAQKVRQVIDTVLELRAGEKFLRVSVSLTNAIRDHRLRLLVPTRQRGVVSSAASGQYGVTVRGRESEGGWGEYPLPTYPATRFVHAGETAVLLDKLVEYEVIDGEEEFDQIALTVVRSIGFMSVNVHPLRDEPAGSELPTPGAQHEGERVELNVGIDLGAPDWNRGALIEHSDVYRLEPIVAKGRGGDPREPEARMSAQGAVALESLRRVEDGLEARFVNYLDVPRPLRVRAEGQWRRCDLTGAVDGDPVDLWELVARPGEIVTVRGGRA